MQYLRRPLIFLAAVVAILSCLQVTTYALEGSETITDAQLVQIRTRCNEIQTMLNRIHANDALLRVNRGQLYERMSTKLMAPLNSRVALNRLDGTALVAATSGFETHLAAFRLNYQKYEESISAAMRIDCVNQPARFYDTLQDARTKRKAVFEATKDLNADIASYGKAFGEFRKKFEGSAS